tara:strand:- start:3635 stop:4402 length:768 start_codon:yes stop_codon:yes gene_type:complete
MESNPIRMSTSIENQVAIVTGGASGIGLAVAQKLNSLGTKVVLLDLDSDSLDQAKESLGGSAEIIQADVTNEESVNMAISQVISRFGKIDIVFNSAGITGHTGIKPHEVDVADFDRVYEVNLKGSFIICKTVIPHMIEAAYGRILLVASVSGKDGNAGMTAYSASKAGVIGLAKSIAKDYADTGVTVNAIAPAVVRTAMVEALPESQVEYMTSRIPMGRCCTLEEIAEMSAFILSPKNSFTTGFCFDLTGGRATY